MNGATTECTAQNKRRRRNMKKKKKKKTERNEIFIFCHNPIVMIP